MKYIAYKTALNDPNLPNGFITEHFETTEPTLEGYQVVPLDVFNKIFQQNILLIRAAEAARGVVPVTHNMSPPTPRPALEAEPLPADFVSPTQTSPTTSTNDPASQQLFSEFLAWLAAGKPGSAP